VAEVAADAAALCSTLQLASYMGIDGLQAALARALADKCGRVQDLRAFLGEPTLRAFVLAAQGGAGACLDENLVAEVAALMLTPAAGKVDQEARALAARGGVTAAELAEVVAGGAGEESMVSVLRVAEEGATTQLLPKGLAFPLPGSQGRESRQFIFRSQATRPADNTFVLATAFRKHLPLPGTNTATKHGFAPV